MDISRDQQRVLHALAQGGHVLALKNTHGRIKALELYTRDGWKMPSLPPLIFNKLKRLRAIASSDGQPYRITRRGLELVRSQFDNR